MENLTRIGFTEKEAQVYLMLLRIGPTPASTLAQRVQMKRVSVYPILETLCAKGVVSYEQTALGRRYIPHDPECLYEQIEMERAQLKMKWEWTRSCVESLQHAERVHSLNGQRVFFCTGLKAVERSLYEHLKGARVIEHLMPSEEGKEWEYLLPCMKVLLKRGLKWVIHSSKQQRKFWEGKCSELEWASEGLLHQNGHLLLTAGKVFFVRWREQEPDLMLIIDPEYAKMLTQALLSKHF